MVQQVVKLCFASTRIARNYLMVDSDNYFLKPFDYKILLNGSGIARVMSHKLYKDLMKEHQGVYLSYGAAPILRERESMSAYDMHSFMKEFFGDPNSPRYGFVMSPFLFSSDVLLRMQTFIKQKGGYSFSHLIKLFPFEMQWYGEYLLQHDKFIPTRGIFELIASPDECRSETPTEGNYGFWFQSVIYEGTSVQGENSQIIYKRPVHCKTEE
jgi:hypothetical protein